MTDDLKLELKVGDTLTIEGPDGSVRTYMLKQITASLPAYGPDWTTTSPSSGLVRLVLHQEDSTDYADRGWGEA